MNTGCHWLASHWIDLEMPTPIGGLYHPKIVSLSNAVAVNNFCIAEDIYDGDTGSFMGQEVYVDLDREFELYLEEYGD